MKYWTYPKYTINVENDRMHDDSDFDIDFPDP